MRSETVGAERLQFGAGTDHGLGKSSLQLGQKVKLGILEACLPPASFLDGLLTPWCNITV